MPSRVDSRILSQIFEDCVAEKRVINESSLIDGWFHVLCGCALSQRPQTVQAMRLPKLPVGYEFGRTH